MDWAAHVFLESSLALGFVSFLFFAVVLLTRNRWPVSARRYSLPGVAILIPSLFAAQKLIVTEREKIWQRLDAFVAAIERNDIEAFGEMLHDGYRADDMDRATMIDFVASMLKELRVYDTRLLSRQVNVENDRAVMNLTATATVSPHGEVGRRHTGEWRLDWLRQSDQWFVRTLRPVSIDLIPIDHLRTLRGASP